MKNRVFILGLILVLLLGTVSAVAESVAIAPEVVAGKIMAYVINEEGAKVYQDIFVEDASLQPVETIEYGTEVEIRTLGLGYCRLRREGKELLYVRTCDLSFSNEDFGNQLAIVFLKRTKNLPLHKEASAKSKTLTKIADGTYVVVLEKGEEFSRVLYGKYDGYLQNAYLSFRSAWEGDINEGKLRDPKNAKRKTTINIRSADAASGKKVASLRTLQLVTVLQIKGDWAEIETEKGIHGYLKADWVEAVEKPATAPVKEPDAETAEEGKEAAETAEEAETVPEDEEDAAAAEEISEAGAEAE